MSWHGRVVTRNDWDFFASEAGDPAWNYESALNIYRRIEDWHGTPDPKYRGAGGPFYVQPAPISNPIFPAMLEGARAAGIPTLKTQTGRMQEGPGGGSVQDIRSRDGKRQSISALIHSLHGPFESHRTHRPPWLPPGLPWKAYEPPVWRLSIMGKFNASVLYLRSCFHWCHKYTEAADAIGYWRRD